MGNIFHSNAYSAIKFFYMVVLSTVVETVFRDTLRMICNIEFKCDSLKFHEQRKQPANHQHLHTAPLKNTQNPLKTAASFSHDVEENIKVPENKT